MEIAALVVFLLIYLGMILGSWPGLAIDRTGIALLGAIAFIELEGISVAKASSYLDYSALAILFSFMIISAQFYFSGFYTQAVQAIQNMSLSPSWLLFVIICFSGILSAFLINDIVCLALTPLIIKICFKKKLDPIPFLLGLACSSNIGSALTLIGNPQNLLIGQVLHISFTAYLKISLIPCLLSLIVTWAIIDFLWKQQWHKAGRVIDSEASYYDGWQSQKGIIAILVIVFIYLGTDLPRDKVALVVAGCFLLSRKMASQTLLSFIDWQLLVLFIGLFIVNKSFLNITNVNSVAQFFTNDEVVFSSPYSLSFIALILSNIVSNVPAVMLILPSIEGALSGSILALSSTFAGNLFIVGSIANMIVVTQALKDDVKIDWKQYVKIGFPVTVASFLILLGWIKLMEAN